ncbi:LysM peptidoglycan-binding domain-containing protein [Cytobacillus purgationiresistens]|uniref:LysM repeat protein n=1 Tax=Cytobacillus purgationiresistens TaxID=863449 RepID=A0ABU0AGL4_9BACI|nr:LysM peptidoglycan-binding domain-containing protein [Cytobacillus purgationiresistens]MDQ0269932.1 LysM repeat protein [Cytobacillus purgationiresistens]
MHGIYLSVTNDSDGFRLPVNPEKVNVSRDGDGEEFKIAKLGSVNIPKDVELTVFELASFFPGQKYHFLVTEYKQPKFYIDKLNRWQKDKLPVRYIYVNGSFAINELVTIESFEYSEEYGSKDVTFTLSLKRYVDFGPKKLKVAVPNQKAVKKTAPSRQNNKSTPKTYTLIKGDSLWRVAQKYTGKGSNYPALAKLNGIKPSQYRKLPIGLKLKIPPSW